MVLTKKEIKHRYFDRVYREAPMVECACGCGMLIKSKDKYGRDKHYVNGHNGRKLVCDVNYKIEHGESGGRDAGSVFALYQRGYCGAGRPR